MKIRNILSGMLALAAAFACTPKEEVIASLNVSRPAVEVPAAGGKVSVEVTSNVAWTASADKDWVSEITPSNGQASDKPATVEIVIAANDGEEREATVTFTAGTVSKTMIITQVGAIEEEEPEDEIIPDHRLYVAWTFTTAWKTRHEKTFSDSADKNELAAGDGGKYIPANAGGEGKLSYVQVDKSQFAAAPKIWRGVGKAGEPYAYGSWIGDYWLFEVGNGHTYPAGTAVTIALGGYTGNNGLMFWMMEYLDGDEWKPAGETYEREIDDAKFDVNFEFAVQDQSSRVVERVKFTKDTKDFKFRIRCVSNYTTQMEAQLVPTNSSLRINSAFGLVITTDKAPEVPTAPDPAPEPEIKLDKTTAEINAESAELEVNVTANVDWTAASDANWVTVEPASGKASDKAVAMKITVAENASYDERKAVITLSGSKASNTFTITQAGKLHEGEVAPLDIQWAFSAGVKAANEKTFLQPEGESDYAAGDAGKYISATKGNGKLTYVQVDKSAFQGATVRRHVGKKGEPVIYSCWAGDQFVFEAENETEYPAGTKLSISFGVYGNNTALKFWSLECFDNGSWKPMETGINEDINGAKSNFLFISQKEGGSEPITGTFTLTANSSDIKFRLICVNNITKEGEEITAPNGKNQRIDPASPIIIKTIE